MDLEQAFRFIWEDKDWPKKIGIAALLALTGVGMIGVFGWLGELARRVAAGDENPLPDWSDIGNYFMKGLQFLGIALIWSFPAALIVVSSSVAITLTAMMDDPGPIIPIMSVFSMCVYVLVFIYIIILNVLSPPLWLLVAEGGSFRTLVNPKSAWNLFRMNAGSFLIAMLIGWLIVFFLSPLGAVVCLVGAFFTSVLSQTIMAHLVGQATHQARTHLEDATEPLIQ